MNAVTNEMVWLMKAMHIKCKSPGEKKIMQDIIDYLQDQLQLKLPL
jgi:hypothetical protein